MPILRLAIPSPLRKEFDYLPPTALDEKQIQSLQPGARVQVSFGRREVTAYLLSVHTDSQVEVKKLKTAIAILDSTSLISQSLVKLCQWASAYYQHPIGEVIPAAFSQSLRKGKEHKPLGVPGWILSTRGKGLPPGALSRSPKQALALQLLQGQEAIASSTFTEKGITTAVIRSLKDKGLIERQTLKLAQTTAIENKSLVLNDEQEAVVMRMSKCLAKFGVHLLEGVTGSGKTEIYLQLIARTLKQGKQALVLIPEIGLTPQTLARFEARFQASIVVLHSGLTDEARYRAWEAARDGSAHIIVGTRSAIFVPTSELGLIIVDEEHDGSYKQQDGFRYSARDIAAKRGQLENCPVMLGSATPSLESIYNVREGRYQHYVLTQRAGGSVMPSIEALDIRRSELRAGLSAPLFDALEKTLSTGNQVLLFLNRRGYAPTLQCHDCGWIAECGSCDARLTVHRRQRKLRCHHCAANQVLPRQCPHCHGNSLMAAGLGTEQTEDYLRATFASYPVFRVDSDTMASKNAMQDLVQEVLKGEPCILLGTQMLTKGHHFPGVSLVAIIDADSSLFSTDFRGEERMAQLLTQVGGRAGRAETPGRVILQTHYPDHPALAAILQKSYGENARDMLERRQEMALPPVGKLLMLRTDSGDIDVGEEFLQALRNAAEPRLPADTRLIGPLPSPMQRRAGKFRTQMLVTTTRGRSAQFSAALLVEIAQTLPVKRGMKWSIDVDPQDTF